MIPTGSSEGSGFGETDTTGYEVVTSQETQTLKAVCPPASSAAAFDVTAFLIGFSIPLLFLILAMIKLYSYHKQLQTRKRKEPCQVVEFVPTDRHYENLDGPKEPRYDNLPKIVSGAADTSGYATVNMEVLDGPAADEPDPPRARSACEDEDGYISSQFLASFKRGDGEEGNVEPAYEDCKRKL